MMTKFARLIVLILLALLAAVVFSGCATLPANPTGAPPEPTTGATGAVPVTEESAPESTAEFAPPTQEGMSPESIALDFFTEYIQFTEAFQPVLGNPEFKSQKYLSDEYLKQLNEIQVGFDGVGFDPILKAQAVPPAPVELSESQVSGDEAQVKLHIGKGVIDPPWEREVSLQRSGDAWQIVPDRVEAGAMTPEETVQSFYNWYLGYIGTGPDFRNPLADKAYRAAPFLTGSLVVEVDRMTEGDQGPGFDPFLCAQDVPAEIHTSASFYNNGQPMVLVESRSFADYYLTAELIRVDFNQWAIRRITCGSSAAGTAKAFYTWMLGYATGGGELHNPWVDAVYREVPFLSPAFLENIDEKMASGEPLYADPALLAQDLPLAFDTAPGKDEGTALVNLQYGNSTIRQLLVEMEEGSFPARIRSVRHLELPESPLPTEGAAGASNWALLTDEAFGYAVRFPAEWQIKGLEVVQSHSPEEFALMRTVSFTPPGEMNPVDPVLLDVLVGGEDLIETQYGWFEPVETVEMNGNRVGVYRSEPGILHYVIRHHSEPVWLIFSDPLSQFPGREETGQEFAGILQMMLSTLVFRH